MKSPIMIIFAVILIIAFTMQVLMFYRIHDRLDQHFALLKNLNHSSYQGDSTWVDNNENWNPYQELLQMRNQLEQIFDHSILRFQRNSPTKSLRNLLAINLKDEKDYYLVTVDIPGTDKSVIDVALNERNLTVSVNIEEKKDSSNKDINYQQNGVFSAKLQRTIQLPGNVDKSRMTTEYNNGVMTIILPKTKSG